MTAYYSQCEDCGWKCVAALPEDLRAERDAHEFETMPIGEWGHRTTPVDETEDMPLDIEVLA